MPRARKKPIEIDYIEFTGDNWEEMRAFCGTRPAGYNPHVQINNFGHADDWIVDPEDDIVGAVYDYLHSTWIGVKVGDYIIKGTKGEFYPHDGDLFWKNYDPVGELYDFGQGAKRSWHLDHTHYNNHEPLE